MGIVKDFRFFRAVSKIINTAIATISNTAFTILVNVGRITSNCLSISISDTDGNGISSLRPRCYMAIIEPDRVITSTGNFNGTVIIDVVIKILRHI